jgi:hypothetical protein
MVELCIGVSIFQEPKLADLAGYLNSFLEKMELACDSQTHQDEPIQVILTQEATDAPFHVLTPRHIVISHHQAEEIAGYVGLEVREYLELCLTLACVQRSAIVQNHLIIGEDLTHPRDKRCLFNVPDQIQGYALQLEELAVCQECRVFYRCLKCEYELDIVEKYLGGLRRRLKYSAT